MGTSSARGGVLGKLLIVVLVLAALGGGGFGAWWMMTATERNLRAFNLNPSEWDWVADHGDDPRVMAAARKRVESLADHRSTLGHAGFERQMAAMDRLFTKNPPGDDGFPALAVKVLLRKKHPPAATWVKEFDKDPRVTAAIQEELIDVGTYPYGWDCGEKALDEHVAQVLSLLEKRGLTAESPGVRKGVIVTWLRYNPPSIRPWFQKLAGTPELAEAVTAQAIAIGGNRGYSTKAPEVSRLLAELVRIKPEPTDRLLLALPRFGGTPEVIQLFQAWGPGAVERMTRLRDSIADDWDKSMATKLLVRLGATNVAPEDVDRILRTLAQRDTSGTFRPPPGDNDPMYIPILLPKDFGSQIEGSIPHTIAQLADLGPSGPPAMATLWNASPDNLRAYVLSRALAKASPELLATSVSQALERFDPLAREVEARGRKPAAVKAMTRMEWRRMAPALNEGLGELCRLEAPSDAVVACLWKAVSSPEPAFSQTAGNTLQQKLPADRFVRGLFLHLSQKPSYLMSEVKTMVGMVTRKEGTGPHVVASLTAILDRLGKPEAVPLIQKVVGLQALAEVGDAKARPILERYAADTSTYIHTEQKVNAAGEVVSGGSTTRKFADLAKAALEKIR